MVNAGNSYLPRRPSARLASALGLTRSHARSTRVVASMLSHIMLSIPVLVVLSMSLVSAHSGVVTDPRNSASSCSAILTAAFGHEECIDDGTWESQCWLLKPTGATSVTLSFRNLFAYNVGGDAIHIYDGRCHVQAHSTCLSWSKITIPTGPDWTACARTQAKRLVAHASHRQRDSLDLASQIRSRPMVRQCSSSSILGTSASMRIGSCLPGRHPMASPSHLTGVQAAAIRAI